MLTLVVARYRENVEWVNQLSANVVILNKAQLGNSGREAASWLWFITTHYESLRGDYVFAQGNPFEHCPDFGQTLGQRRHYGTRLQCDWDGAPQHPGLPLVFALAQLGLFNAHTEKPLEFTMGAQFQRSARELRAVDLAQYAAALEFAKNHPQGPWVLERLWDWLIP